MKDNDKKTEETEVNEEDEESEENEENEMKHNQKRVSKNLVLRQRLND